MTYSGIEIIHQLMGRFFSFWLPNVRKLSPRTISTYKDSCKSYLAYLKASYGVSASMVSIEHFSHDHVVGFISWLNNKELKAATINLRLGVLKVFSGFAMEEDPSVWNVLHGIQSIKPIRQPSSKIKYLTKAQFKTLLSIIDISTKTGLRDYVLISFCYLSGARVSELISVKIKDLIKEGKKVSVKLLGKGNKTRIVPIEGMNFLRTLKRYLGLFHSSSSGDDYLFYTSYREYKAKMSRTTIDALLKKYGVKAVNKSPGFPIPLHCHMLRHSRAMHLHAEGLPIVYIRDFLGHANINSTSIYAWTEVPTMRRALKKVQKLRTKSLEEEEKKATDPDAEALKIMGLD